MRKVLTAALVIALIIFTGCSSRGDGGKWQDYQLIDKKAFNDAPAMDFGDVKVGDIIEFGSYIQRDYQDEEIANSPYIEKDPIEWIVLEKRDNRILVISRYGLDYKPYNDTEDSDIFWKDCSLRCWLNSNFFSEAFTQDEQRYVPTVLVSTEVLVLKPNNFISKEIKAGESTEDKVFLLNRAEAEKYFDSDESRIAEATPLWSWEAGLQPGWWLRTPANLWLDDPIAKKETCIVSYNGKLFVEHDENLYSHRTNYSSELVRPVLWIKTEH